MNPLLHVSVEMEPLYVTFEAGLKLLSLLHVLSYHHQIIIWVLLEVGEDFEILIQMSTTCKSYVSQQKGHCNGNGRSFWLNGAAKYPNQDLKTSSVIMIKFRL